jgi:hypothetical protein
MSKLSNEQTNNATRRDLLTAAALALPATLVATTVLAGGTDREDTMKTIDDIETAGGRAQHPDAELIRLGREFDAAAANLAAVVHELSVRERLAIDSYPPRPTTFTASIGWEAEQERVRRQYGVPEAEAEEDRAGTALAEIADRIMETPATTLAGLLVKRRLADKADQVALLHSIAADLDAMAAA